MSFGYAEGKSNNLLKSTLVGKMVNKNINSILSSGFYKKTKVKPILNYNPDLD